MRPLHLPHWPHGWRPHWPALGRDGLRLPDSVAHPSGRVVDEAAVVAAIVAVCILLVLAF
ncbi:MAG: hypothetical protein U1E30_00330 [Rhodoblastus sp.]